MSHPSWVCGLKLLQPYNVKKAHEVTPFVGVWIETLYQQKQAIAEEVTPFVGVWIETWYAEPQHNPYSSHTLRGCVD